MDRRLVKQNLDVKIIAPKSCPDSGDITVYLSKDNDETFTLSLLTLMQEVVTMVATKVK